MIDVKLPFRRSIDQLAALTLVGTIGLVMTPTDALAQLTPWGGNPSVLVDESVTGGAARGSTTGFIGLSGGSTGEVLPPPPTMPRSTLLTPRPPSGAPVVEQTLPRVTLTPPSQRQARRTQAPRPAARPAPRPQPPVTRPLPAPPAAPKVAKAAPTPLAKPEPAPAPAPPPAPKVAEPAPAPKPSPPPTQVASAPPAPKIESAAPPPPTAAPKPAPAQQASRAPTPDVGPLQTVAFAPGEASLTGDGRKVLDSLATSLTEDPNLRMQLLAYAGEPNLSASKARRLSLSRALSVRSYLIGKGIRSTRIDVRALGNKVPSGAPNRVDLRTITR